MNLQNMTIKEYLNLKNIPFRESGNELITHCLFGTCDDDSKGQEAHLYLDADTGQYDCKKCGAKGNLITLAKHLGDISDKPIASPKKTFNPEEVEKHHATLPERIREYLNKRGITNAVIDEQKLGYGTFFRKAWITIPIKDIYGNYSYFKLRRDPADGNEKMTSIKGVEAQLYGFEVLEPNLERVVICEGELDRLALASKGIPAVTSTHGAGTFKPEWIEQLVRVKEIFICFDSDEAGRKGSLRVAEMLRQKGHKGIKLITLPEKVGEHGDVTDYFTKLSGTTEDFFGIHAKDYPEKIDTSQLHPMTTDQLIETLDLTIKYDDENKLATFLCELSAYTEDSQFNVSYNAPSSTGKSFIPTEIARLFPEDDVLEIAYCSPTAFFHDNGEYDKEKNLYTVDLSRKILIFLDQPHNELLARLRPLLSHDKKEITLKITDKSQKHGLKTKNVLLRGFPSVIFCTAGLRIDEQEATRFLLLSPQVSQKKIQEGISSTIYRESDKEAFNAWLEADPNRKLLRERIRAIKLEGITDVNILHVEQIEGRFFEKNKKLKPRHQRDIKRLLSFVKVFAVLNLWFRERNGTVIVANEDDIQEAFKLWDKISLSQELNLPPYIFDLYRDVIIPAWKAKNEGLPESDWLGLSRQELMQKHFEVYDRMLDVNQLRQQILPMLENAGLIVQEQDDNDKRKILIQPTSQYHHLVDQRNGDDGGGVEDNKDESSGEQDH